LAHRLVDPLIPSASTGAAQPGAGRGPRGSRTCDHPATATVLDSLSGSQILQDGGLASARLPPTRPLEPESSGGTTMAQPHILVGAGERMGEPTIRRIQPADLIDALSRGLD